jgi:hypothetical protein
MKFIPAACFLLLMVCLSQEIWAQKAPKSDVMLGLNLTGSSFYGDLNYKEGGVFRSDFFSANPGIDLSIRGDRYRRILPVMHLGYGRFVSQNDSLGPIRYIYPNPELGDTLIPVNRAVRTDFIYSDVGVHINFVRRDALFRPYLSLRFGGMLYFPKDLEGRSLFKKRSTRVPGETYGTFTWSAPATLGVEIRLGQRVNLNLSYTYRYTGTDYLDNIGLVGERKAKDEVHSVAIGANFRIFDRKQDFPFLSSIDTALVNSIRNECDSTITDYAGKLSTLEAQNKLLQQSGGTAYPPGLVDTLVAFNQEMSEMLAGYKRQIDLMKEKTGYAGPDSFATVPDLPLASDQVEYTQLKKENALLKLENQSLREQVEDNLRFVEEQVGEIEKSEQATQGGQLSLRRLSFLNDSLRDANQMLAVNNKMLEDRTVRDQSAIRTAREQLERVKAGQDKDKLNLVRVADSLKQVIVELEKEVALLENADEMIRERISELKENERAYKEKELEQINRQNLLNTRETHLAEQQTEIEAKEKQYADLNEKINELQRLEQRLINKGITTSAPEGTGDPSDPKEIDLRIPTITVISSNEPEKIRGKIRDYFSRLNYYYAFENGRIVYRDVILPGISEFPMDISFAMLRNNRNERLLSATFLLAGGDYLSTEKYPVETNKAKSLVASFAK